MISTENQAIFRVNVNSYHQNGGYISSLFPIKFNGSFLINVSRIIAFISLEDPSFPPSTSASLANSFCIRYPLSVHIHRLSIRDVSSTDSTVLKRDTICTFSIMNFDVFGERQGTTSKTFQVERQKKYTNPWTSV